jgi:hypothetical protein
MSTSEEDEQSNADDTVDTVAVELAASAGGPKATKHRNRFPKMRKGEHEYPFLERPCTRDLTIFKCLLISQPFRVGKGLLTNAWASAVKDINGQVDPHSGEKVFDPPLAVKTVRERFKDAMSIIATINNRIAFQSGCDDEASPNELRRVLEDLLEQKRDAELKADRVKLSVMAKKKHDRDAAKTLQAASIGKYDELSDIEESAVEESPDSGEQSTGETATKKRRSTLNDSFSSITEMMEQRKLERDKNNTKRQEVATKQLEVADRQLQAAERAMELQLQMCNVLKGINDKLNDK